MHNRYVQVHVRRYGITGLRSASATHSVTSLESESERRKKRRQSEQEEQRQRKKISGLNGILFFLSLPRMYMYAFRSAWCFDEPSVVLRGKWRSVKCGVTTQSTRPKSEYLFTPWRVWRLHDCTEIFTKIHQYRELTLN